MAGRAVPYCRFGTDAIQKNMIPILLTYKGILCIMTYEINLNQILNKI